MSSSQKFRILIIIIGLTALLVIFATSCSNTKNLYKNYPPLPENKSDTFQLPYHFVE